MTIEYLADRREFITTVAQWLHDEWGHLRLTETVNDRVARVERACGRREIPTTFVAIYDNKPVGCASLVEHDMLTRPELSPWLAGVFVPREHRRRGVGAALVERVVQEARSLRVPRLYLYTPGTGARCIADLAGLCWSARFIGNYGAKPKLPSWSFSHDFKGVTAEGSRFVVHALPLI